MKRVWFVLIALLLLLAACGSDGDEATPVATEPTQAEVAVEEAPTEPPATATPVPEPTEPAVEIAGIWLGTLAGERGYFMYMADGRYQMALSQDALTTAPLVTGEYWFENGQIHLRDLENAGHWTECDTNTVGIYDVVDLGDGQMEFQLVDDACGSSGFTRSYVFGNMKQEWIAEPVDVDAP